MTPLRFYEHFACGYGTIWLLLLTFSLLIQEHINTGPFGLFGFPVIALVYAFIRRANQGKIVDEREALRSEIDKLWTALQDKDHPSG